jgi:hypothetical protein
MFLWEGLALAGLLHIRLHPNANPIWDLNFFYNALFFLVAYPILYVYRWKMAGGCLGTIMWPLSFVLSGCLGISAYLWTTYLLLWSGSPYANSMKNHWLVLGPLFALVYFPLVEPLWGISRKFFSMGQLFGILFYSALCGFLSLLLARFVDQKFGESMGTNRFLLWLGLVLLGSAVGALIARQRGKE